MFRLTIRNRGYSTTMNLEVSTYPQCSWLWTESAFRPADRPILDHGSQSAIGSGLVAYLFTSHGPRSVGQPYPTYVGVVSTLWVPHTVDPQLSLTNLPSGEGLKMWRLGLWPNPLIVTNQ
jgi:hypothetical protein